MKIVCMNVGTWSQKPVPNVNLRKQGIVEVLNVYMPLFVFTQEFSWTSSMQSAKWGTIKAPEQYLHTGHKEAGFIYDKNSIVITSIDTLVLKIYDEMKYSVDDFALSRFCIRMVEIRGLTGCIMCASWHGQYKVSLSTRQSALKKLLQFLLKLKVNMHDVELLVAGDFNITALQVAECLPKAFHMKRPSDKSLDMFLVVGNIKNALDNLQPIKIKASPFDHQPLELTLESRKLPSIFYLQVGNEPRNDTYEIHCGQTGGIIIREIEYLQDLKAPISMLFAPRLLLFRPKGSVMPFYILFVSWRGSSNFRFPENVLINALNQIRVPYCILFTGDIRLTVANSSFPSHQYHYLTSSRYPADSIFPSPQYLHGTSSRRDTTDVFIIDKKILNFVYYELQTMPHYGCPDEHRILNLKLFNS